MYGIYDEEIMELRKKIVEIEKERKVVRKSIDEFNTKYGYALFYRQFSCEHYNKWSITELETARRQFIMLAEKLDELYISRIYAENEIDRLKVAWRDSRPRDGYFPMDDIDLMSKIRENGFINGRII